MSSLANVSEGETWTLPPIMISVPFKFTWKYGLNFIFLDRFIQQHADMRGNIRPLS